MYLKREGIEIDESITSGVVITESIADGPCYKAKLKKGDIINKIGDYSVDTVAELQILFI